MLGHGTRNERRWVPILPWALLFSSRFFSNCTSNLQSLYWDGYMLPNQILIHETDRYSQIWPKILSCGFVGVVWRLRFTAGWCRSPLSPSLFLSLSLCVFVCVCVCVCMCVCVVRLLFVRFISWSKNVNAMTEKLSYKSKLGDIELYNLQETFSYVFFIWLKCTLGKHNQVRPHWNRGYDNAPETKVDEFDSFIPCKFLPLVLRIRENLNDVYIREA